MNYRNLCLISLIVIFSSLLFLSPAAADNCTDMTGNCTVEDGEIEEMGNFTQLNSQINEAESELALSGNYSHVSNDSELEFNRSIVIDGQNHIIDFNNHSRILRFTNDVNVTFKNLTFANVMPLIVEDLGFEVNLTFVNCRLNDYLDGDIEAYYYNESQIWSYGGEISEQVEDLAKLIVGNSKGIAAAKKLAKWVNENIAHEKREGFYQSCCETLMRRIGNCCAHTELFLQMCDAIGLSSNHTLAIVHVGGVSFGYRHFFALFDNVCVDTDCVYANPWGNGHFKGREVYIITYYPMLPLIRTY